MRKIFENKAILFDGHLQPANTEWYYDFATAAAAECFNIIDWENWYVDCYDNVNRIITIKNRHNDLCFIEIHITADPVDEDDDIWLVYDIWIEEPTTMYSFQIPS